MRSVRLGRHALRVADDQPTFWDRVEAGLWEPCTLAILEERLGPATTFVDCGAWIGALSLIAAAQGARAIAVEADPSALEQLGRNLAANPELASRITVIDRAVSAGTGPVRLGARRKPGDSMSSALLADAETSWEAAAVTPGELAAMIDPSYAVLVKVDIEGGEYALLPALTPLLDRPGAALLLSLHPTILAETGEPDPHGRALEALASLRGWTTLAVTDTGPRPCALDRDALARWDNWLLTRPDRTTRSALFRQAAGPATLGEAGRERWTRPASRSSFGRSTPPA